MAPQREKGHQFELHRQPERGRVSPTHEEYASGNRIFFSRPSHLGIDRAGFWIGYELTDRAGYAIMLSGEQESRHSLQLGLLWPKLSHSTERIRNNMQIQINYKQLAKRCRASLADFFCEGQVTNTKDGPYIFKDNGAKILCVAHLDTVINDRFFTVGQEKGHKVVWNNQLDDRLGAYIILDLLPSLGIKCDILLTDGEERGRSTAAQFIAAKDYNWVFEFDRRGTDVVMYQYETKKRRKLLQKHGFRVGFGSFSDISELDFLGVTCFNFGCGYYGEHSRSSYMVVSDTVYMVSKFVKFYNAMKDKRLPFDQKQACYGFGSSKWWDYEDDITTERAWKQWEEKCRKDKQPPTPTKVVAEKWYDRDTETLEDYYMDEYGNIRKGTGSQEESARKNSEEFDGQAWINDDYTVSPYLYTTAKAKRQGKRSKRTR